MEGGGRRGAPGGRSWAASPGWARPAWPPRSPRASTPTAPSSSSGRCDEDLGVPYQPFVEALRHFAGHAHRRRPHVSARAPWRRARPARPGAGRDLSQPARAAAVRPRDRALPALRRRGGLAGRRHRGAPVLLVLDDLQWATKPTLLLLRHIARSAGPDAAARRRHLPRHRACLGPPARRGPGRPAPPGRCGAARASRASTSAGSASSGGRRRPRARRPGAGSGPGDPRRDGGEPVLRRRGSAPPRRDRGPVPTGQAGG